MIRKGPRSKGLAVPQETGRRPAQCQVGEERSLVEDSRRRFANVHRHGGADLRQQAEVIRMRVADNDAQQARIMTIGQSGDVRKRDVLAFCSGYGPAQSSTRRFPPASSSTQLPPTSSAPRWIRARIRGRLLSPRQEWRRAIGLLSRAARWGRT